MSEKVAIISNVWTNMISLNKGEVHSGHAHTFDHTHLLSVGSVKLTIDGVESEFTAPTQIFIKRGLAHSMECLSEESLGTCIHVIRNGMRVEDIVDPKMMPSYSVDEDLCRSFRFVRGKFMESESVEWDDEDRPT